MIMELPKHLGINEHTINLEISKQQLFKLIYSLEQVELETFQT